jgi:AcrR family transcriptional regulator
LGHRDLIVNVIITQTKKSARKPKGDGHQRRAEILAAAERIFVAEGYERSTIRRIADEVGVSSTALYMHFQDKAEILLEICAEALVAMLANNTKIAQMPGDPVVRVRAILETYMDFALNNANAYQLVFCAMPSEVTQERSQAATDLGAQSFDRFRSVVAEIADAGRLRTGTVDTAAQTLWAACHGLTTLLITRPAFNWEPAADLRRLMLDAMLQGMVTD